MGSTYELGIIGAGNMAEGILAAVITEKLYAPNRVIVGDPVADRLKLFADQFGVDVAENNLEVVSESKSILLAIKPQAFTEIAAPLRSAVTDEHLLISIMAGMSTAKIAAAFPGIATRVVRVMPNLPIRVGAGMAGICGGVHATPQDVHDTQAMFDAGGSSVVVDDESLMDVVTAVSGSGPAYFYYFVEQIVAGAVANGMSEADAMKLAQHTCLGAAKMMLESDESPATLRAKVTSKGGTTQAALEHMDKSKVPDALQGAIQAAVDRGRELGS